MRNEVNVSDRLRLHATERPNKPALIVPDGQGWTSITYKALNVSVDQYARGFQAKGISRGDRVLFLVKPGIEMYGALFGLFRLGAVPVLLDPGMGIPAVLECIEQIKPTATVAIPLVHVIRVFKRKPFATSKLNVTAGARWFWGGPTLAQCKADGDEPYQVANDRSASDEGFIAFTSGSTGLPKGVSFLQSMFIAQSDLLSEVFQWTTDKTTVECFAAFVIFDLASGMTVVIPDMNLSKPAKADPANVVKAINDHKAHTAFASPVVWANVTRWCQANNTKLSSLERVLTAGAPIPADMHRRFKEILADGAQLHTPYGATEALPVSTIGSTEVLNETWERTSQGWGTCIGTLFPAVDVKIIPISDEPIPTWSDDLTLDAGIVGEIVVDAPIVSPEYKDRAKANAVSKIERDGRIMHRMGDLGYIDDSGRLWFCGRKAHALWTAAGKYTAEGVHDNGMIPAVPVEGLFNDHSKVLRTALVGVGPTGSHTPVLCVQLEQGEAWTDALSAELLAMAKDTRWDGVVQRILHNPQFPTDARHNSKIKRGELRAWADAQCADLIKEST